MAQERKGEIMEGHCAKCPVYPDYNEWCRSKTSHRDTALWEAKRVERINRKRAYCPMPDAQCPVFAPGYGLYLG